MTGCFNTMDNQPLGRKNNKTNEEGSCSTEVGGERGSVLVEVQKDLLPRSDVVRIAKTDYCNGSYTTAAAVSNHQV